MMAALRIPTATYRFQFNAGFTFNDARALVPYLHALGITDIYASPIFKPCDGSEHGYDVTDLTQLNPALGTEADFRTLIEALRAHDMGLLLDIVPNHMAAGLETPWWFDVLSYGVHSQHAHVFDITWNPSSDRQCVDALVLPVLGAPYGDVLERGELRIALEPYPVLCYWEHRFPLYPGSLAPLLDLAMELGNGDTRSRLARLYEKARSLPPVRSWTGSPDATLGERAENLQARLGELTGKSETVRSALQKAVDRVNGEVGRQQSFDLLDGILSAQAYRLAWWRKASEAVNYRRFFDINDLVGLRMEDPAVFAATHQRVLDFVREGLVTGLRLDHIDGLYDPRGYLVRLQQTIGGSVEPTSLPFFVVAEKIVGADERIPDDWPVSGTTGYEFLNNVHGVFVDHRGLKSLNRTYQRFSGSRKNFADVVYECKKQVLHDLFSGEVERFTAWLARLATADRHARDLPSRALAQAFIEVSACFPVYRTYTSSFSVAPRDRAYVLRALDDARVRTTPDDSLDAAFTFLCQVLLLDPLPPDGEQAEARLAFVRRWQQFTGPATAKGLEDTAFYRHNRLISLNAVGGDVQEVEHPVHVDGFHRFNSEQRRFWPWSLNTTSTHDTKRSEDVEMRINVISELPRAWARRFRRWSRLNAPYKQLVGGKAAPDANEEIFLYQTLLGSWPLQDGELPDYRERIRNVMRKALREEKVHTSWLDRNAAWEEAVDRFIELILAEDGDNRFVVDLIDFQATLARHGCWNGLSQQLLKVTSPGIPDIYRGTELWDLSLVDPDNRRPVDFALRRRLLKELWLEEQNDSGRLLTNLLGNWHDGRIKLYLTAKALRFRREHPALFLQGEYLPLTPQGARERNVCAYARQHEGDWVLTVIPRLTTMLRSSGAPPLGARTWRDTTLLLPEGAPLRWKNVLTGETVSASGPTNGEDALAMAELLASFPVALLHAEG